MKVIFMGNPNSGKSTLFNNTTRAQEHVANWHGVTVSVAQKTIKVNNIKTTFYDLPGLYSLNIKSHEEKIALDFLNDNKDAVIFNICAYETLERSLYLTYELKKAGYNIVLVINTMGGSYSELQLSELRKKLEIDIIQLDARKQGKKIKEYLIKSSNDKQKTVKALNSNYRDYKTFFNVFPVVILKNNNKLDKVLLHKSGGIFIFAAILGLIFYITFGPFGSFLSIKFTEILIEISLKIQTWISFSSLFWLSDLFDMVVTKGLVGVMSFLPQLVLMLSLLWCLEEIGYLPRMAFLFNDFLSKYSLSGRSTLSLIMGVGCTTTAVLTSRNMENLAIRQRTAFLLPFISCSAKLPVFICISSLFFVKYKVLITFLLYIFGISVGLFVLKFLPQPKKSTPFILELPSLKRPSLRRVLSETWKTTKESLIRIGGVVAIVSALIWFMQNFDFRFDFVGSQSEDNMLFSISRLIAVLFTPLGFGNWQTIVALITGFIAKESIIASLYMLGAEQLFTFYSAISFLIFVLFYSPCLSAISTIRREFGIKKAVLVAVYHTLIAYVLAMIVYTFLLFFNMPVLIGFVFAISILIFLTNKFRRKKCSSCRLCPR